MSCLFDDASSQYLEVNTAAVASRPLSISAWFYPDDLSTAMSLVFLGDKDATNHFFELLVQGDTTDALRARENAGGSPQAATTANTPTLGAWNHAFGYFSSSTDRGARLNGSTLATNTTSYGPPVGPDRTSIGRRGASTPLNYFSGRLAEVAVWNVKLNNDEQLALAAGAHPTRIRPLALRGYWPLLGVGSPEPDLSGVGTHLTVTGATAADHVPIFPRRAWRRMRAPVVSAAVVGHPMVKRWGGVPFMRQRPSAGGGVW